MRVVLLFCVCSHLMHACVRNFFTFQRFALHNQASMHFVVLCTFLCFTSHNHFFLQHTLCLWLQEQYILCEIASVKGSKLIEVKLSSKEWFWRCYFVFIQKRALAMNTMIKVGLNYVSLWHECWILTRFEFMFLFTLDCQIPCPWKKQMPTKRHENSTSKL